MDKKKIVKLSDELAARATSHGIHVFGYFEDEGEIHKDAYASSLMLADYEIAALAVNYLKLPAMLEEVIGLYEEFQHQHGYSPERARDAAVLEILEGLGALEEIAAMEANKT